ncbi:hypothetical protein P5V15_009699 [Pogonomyrmex californicus]
MAIKTKFDESGLTSFTISTELQDHHGRPHEDMHSRARVIGQCVPIMMAVMSIVSVVLLMLGVILIVSGLLRGDHRSTRVWWHNPFTIGLLTFLAGVFLTALNGAVKGVLPRRLYSKAARQIPIQRIGAKRGERRVDHSSEQTGEANDVSNVVGHLP